MPYADRVAPDLSAFASTLFDLRATLSHSSVEIDYTDLSAESVALRSGYANAQDDLELHCPHNYDT